MNRKLKALGLALMAVLAMSAVVASSALAVDEFTAEGGAAVIRGSQEGLTANNYFEVTGTKLHCETADYQARLGAVASKELTVTPHFGLNNGAAGQDCVATGLEQKATVTLNGCDFRFTTHGTDPSGNVTGTADVVCPAGKQIEVHIVNICTVDIPEQTGLTGVTFINKGTNTITINVDITNQITTIDTKPSIFCPFPGGHSPGNSFVSNVTAECFVDPTGTEAGPTGANTTYKIGAKRNCHVK